MNKLLDVKDVDILKLNYDKSIVLSTAEFGNFFCSTQRTLTSLKKEHLMPILRKFHDVTMCIYKGHFVYFLELAAGKFTKQALNARNTVFTCVNVCGLHR